MLRRKKTNAACQFAIDSGAFYTRFYSTTHGLLFEQPSIAVLDMDHPIGGSKAVNSFGDEAEALIQRELDGLRSINPVQSDQHNDLGLRAKMLCYFLAATTRAGVISRSPSISLMLNQDCSPITRARLSHACTTAGARSIEIQDAATAAFYGTQLASSQPCIMIDFGASGSRMFAIENGKVVHQQNLFCGGDAFDSAIVDGMLERFNLFISNSRAREIDSQQVDCLSVKTNTMTRFTVSSTTVNQLLQPTLEKLSQSISIGLSHIDNSLKDAAYETGIKICGGGALLSRICGGGALLSRMDQLVMAATESWRPLTCRLKSCASHSPAMFVALHRFKLRTKQKFSSRHFWNCAPDPDTASTSHV